MSNNLRQAAQAALSCVEFFPGQYKNSITSDQRTVFDALRAALAEPQPAPKGWAGWAQIGLLNGNPYLRMVYDRTPYPPPPDVVKNLNLVPVYLGATPQAQQPKSVDDLLIEYPHLTHCVAILIRGCLSGEGHRAIGSWDKARGVKP